MTIVSPRRMAAALALLLPALALPAAAQHCPETGLAPANFSAYVKRIQEELPRHGYRAGPVDGRLGQRTRSGIRAYQRDARLYPDGCVSVELLDHMLYHQPKVYAGGAADTTLERQVQQELRGRGYYRGPVDGIVGPRTRAALEAFQRDAGLRVSPHVNRSTLAALRDADPSVRAR